MPHPQQELLTAWILQLAAGKWQQVRQQHITDASSSSGSSVLFPVDLRYYCGRSWPLQETGALAAVPAVAAAAAVAKPVVCCFLSGWQCSSCAIATAASHAVHIDAQLDACRTTLAGLRVDMEAVEGSAGSKCRAADAVDSCVGLTDAQLQQLVEATHMYHLQQQWWYDDSATAPAAFAAHSCADSHVSSSNSRAEPRWQLLPAVDQVRLANLQLLLQPLRDVAALREVQLQQQQAGNAWPEGDFEGMVHTALEGVAAQKRQQSKLQRQLQRCILEPASADIAGLPSVAAFKAAVGSSSAGFGAAAVDTSTAAAAAVAGGDDDVMEDESSSDDAMDIDEEALDVLAAATDDFMVQQFRRANAFALHAGRQEVGPEDLRLALLSSGYSHMMPRPPAPAAGRLL